jgi:hypothetical protein
MEKKEYYDDSVIEIKESSVIMIKEISLPKGKTTLKGEYPKLNQDRDCAYPERASCNYGEFFKRCEYMKCKSFGDWKCEFKNDKAS